MSELTEKLGKQVDRYFIDKEKDYNCAETVLTVMSSYFGIGDDVIPSIAKPFGGGYASTHRFVCGGVSGGLMAIGIKEKKDPAAVARELIAFIKEKYGSIICNEILSIDFDNAKQVAREKEPKRNTICYPLLKDICGWIAERLG
ncbi:MAG: C_GCAxxG_C_C family protein [Spirochaetales bacterium]|nr:C_GCAxxG_C_C family protein [Spirochaetales bacterium]